MKINESYSKQVLKYFKNPKNMGKIKNPDSVGKVGNPVCGDVMWLYIKIKKNRISEIKFSTFGCVAAIATSSMITELAKGKTIEQALKITKEDVARSLGGLPLIKLHCSVLASDALAEAIYDYLSERELPISKDLIKRHEKIVRETKIIEERYKDYVNMEKKVCKIKE
jgi:nitrogen fixation NifU-like protein